MNRIEAKGTVCVDVADLIDEALAEGGFSKRFSKVVPSALDVEEPVVVSAGRFARESRIEGEERGRVLVCVLVVREASPDAEAVAGDIERHLRRFDWERSFESGSWRIVGVDSAGAAFKERDSSGRFVWQVDIEVTAVREI